MSEKEQNTAVPQTSVENTERDFREQITKLREKQLRVIEDFGKRATESRIKALKEQK